MDQDLLRDALLARARRHRNRRRARLASVGLLVLAVAALGWQLVLAGVRPDFLSRWWPAVAACAALVAAGVLWSRTRPVPRATLRRRPLVADRRDRHHGHGRGCAGVHRDLATGADLTDVHHNDTRAAEAIKDDATTGAWW